MARSQTLRLALGIASVALLGIAAPNTAHAQRIYVYGPPPPRPYRPYAPDPEPIYRLVLAADIEGAVPLTSNTNGNSYGGGAGFKLRVGEQIRLPGSGVYVTPEVEYGFDHLWANNDGATDADGNLIPEYDEQLQRIAVGARVGFGRFFVPVVYAHAGYGWRGTGNPALTGNSGLAFDVGGALDLRFRWFAIGVHAEYDQIALSNETPQWLATGVHGELLF